MLEKWDQCSLEKVADTLGFAVAEKDVRVDLVGVDSVVIDSEVAA